ncbi:uroporphyrinogen decarboxylase family protein [Planctomycetota bacterium]
MTERIDISVDPKRIEENEEKQQRLEAVHRGEQADRTPVVIDMNLYFMLEKIGSDFQKAMASPADNLIQQVLCEKWHLENIDDDGVVPTEALSFTPFIGCIRGVEFEMDISWEGDAPKCSHPLHDPAQIDDLDIPDPDSGLNTMYREWTVGMQAAAEELEVRINDSPVEIRVSKGHGGGPIPAAFALAGENMLMWMLTDPERMHKLMDIVTTSHINCVRYWDELMGREPSQQVWLGCDTAEMLSPELYREFVVPYYNRVWKNFPKRRVMHMCGGIDHLLGIIRDEMQLDFLTGFGFPTDRHKLSEEFSGRVVMSGGPSPMLVKDGSPDAIAAETHDYMATVGRAGGYQLQSGGGIAVGTSLENINAMVSAARASSPAGG